MKNTGLTLIELIITMVISGIILLALTCQFIAEHTFRAIVNNQIAATNDASIAMRHMVRVLRYAQPSTVSTVPATGYSTSITATIDHAFAGNNLPEFTSDTIVIYGRKSDNSFEYNNGSAAYLISNNITVFTVMYDNVHKNLTIQITAQYGNNSSSLNTQISIAGG